MEENSKNTIIELLEDEHFIALANHADAESKAYWERRMSEGQLSKADYELALEFVDHLRPEHPDLTQAEIADIWTNIGVEIDRSNRRKFKRLLWFSGIAASVALITGIYLFRFSTREVTPLSASIAIEQVRLPENVSGDEIRIILSDEKQMALKEETAEIVYDKDGSVNVGSLSETQSAGDDKEVAKFNQVIVPKGKRSTLMLSDGSKLHLNTMSRVVYPPVFNGDKREIFVEGEIYAEINPDDGRPFVVKTNDLQINVLGTSFNVTAYKDDIAQSVVLVKGSVSVKANNTSEEKTLKPNQMLTFSHNVIEIQTVDAGDYISWKDGYYIFRNEKLSYILTRLARYYGQDIRYSSEAGELRFAGKLDLKEDLSRVLNGFTKVSSSLRCEKADDAYFINLLN
ncbi:MAG: FecR domain-containing protein [Dysgonamonadaceae bacterium]|jgi:ferric-dicitrate binding protein FerR (iron transport regulator)|nr:FecR domain-containing protein [Dysgonamonadaceae bacterium]